MTDQHVTKIKSYVNHEYRAICVCGWRSIKQPDRERVVATAFFHREAHK